MLKNTYIKQTCYGWGNNVGQAMVVISDYIDSKITSFFVTSCCRGKH